MDAPITVTELQEILRLHAAWARGEEGGKRANLVGANLYEANLYKANLERANLVGANPGKNEHLFIIGQDMRGYIFYGWRNLEGVVVVKAGCRELIGIGAARQHWQMCHTADDNLHADCLSLVDRCEWMAKVRGWKLEVEAEPVTEAAAA